MQTNLEEREERLAEITGNPVLNSDVQEDTNEAKHVILEKRRITEEERTELEETGFSIGERNFSVVNVYSQLKGVRGDQ